MSLSNTTKTSVKNLPEAALTHVKGLNATKRNCRVVVVNDDAFNLTAWNPYWYGGSIEDFYLYNIASPESLVHMHPAMGQSFKVQAGCVIICRSFFCGKESDPVVYVRNTDLAAFYGVTLPAEFDGMPAEVAADWLNDQVGEKVAGRRATTDEKAKRLAADMIRVLTGLVAA